MTIWNKKVHSKLSQKATANRFIKINEDKGIIQRITRTQANILYIDEFLVKKDN